MSRPRLGWVQFRRGVISPGSRLLAGSGNTGIRAAEKQFKQADISSIHSTYARQTKDVKQGFHCTTQSFQIFDNRLFLIHNSYICMINFL